MKVTMVVAGPAEAWWRLTAARWEALGYQVQTVPSRDWVRTKLALVRRGVGWIVDADIVPCRPFEAPSVSGPAMHAPEFMTTPERHWFNSGVVFAPNQVPVHWRPQCRERPFLDVFALNLLDVWEELPGKYNFPVPGDVDTIPSDVIFAHALGQRRKVERITRLIALSTP